MIEISMATALYLYITCFLLGFLFMTSLYFYVDKQEHKYSYFFLFFAFSLIGASFLLLGGIVDAKIIKVIANGFIVSSYLVLVYGLQELFGLKKRKIIYFVILVVFLIPFSYFVYIVDNISVRVYIINLTNISILCFGLYMMTKKRREVIGYEILFLSLLGIIIVALMRILNFAINRETTNQLLLFKYDPFYIALVGIVSLLVIPGILNIIKSQKELSLFESEARLRKSQSVAKTGSWELDIEGSIIWASDEAFRIYEIEQNSNLIGYEQIKAMVSEEDRVLLNKTLADLIAGKNDYNITFVINPTTSPKVIHSEAELTLDDKGNPVKVIGVIRDITELKQYQDQLINISIHDELTGLYNRRYYEEQIKQLEQNKVLVSMIMADINGLKLVNDAFGHQKGDELLRKAAKVLEKHKQKEDILCRIGGDEFIFLLPNKTAEDSEKIVQEINKALQNEKIENINLSISFGIAVQSSNMTINELFSLAEDRMYQAKLVNVPSMRGSAINSIMSTLNEKDPASEKHVGQVSKLSALLAQKMNLPQDQVNEIRNAGLLHDIGKIIIPLHILNKEGQLTDSEYKIMKTHPIIGYRILNSVADTRSIAKIVLSHHEHWDGNGYPNQMRGLDIPLQSRIISIADAFDAMTTKRTYQETRSNEDALKELIHCSGTQFDPDIVKVFEKHFKDITI